MPAPIEQRWNASQAKGRIKDFCNENRIEHGGITYKIKPNPFGGHTTFIYIAGWDAIRFGKYAEEIHELARAGGAHVIFRGSNFIQGG